MGTVNPHRLHRDKLNEALRGAQIGSHENIARNYGYESFEELKRKAAEEEAAEKASLPGLLRLEDEAATAQHEANTLAAAAEQRRKHAVELVRQRDASLKAISEWEQLLQLLEGYIASSAAIAKERKQILVANLSDPRFMLGDFDLVRHNQHAQVLTALIEDAIFPELWKEARSNVRASLAKEQRRLEAVIRELKGEPAPKEAQ